MFRYIEELIRIEIPLDNHGGFFRGKSTENQRFLLL